MIPDSFWIVAGCVCRWLRCTDHRKYSMLETEMETMKMIDDVIRHGGVATQRLINC